MNAKKATIWMILVSLFFAGAIVVASYLLKDSFYADSVTYGLIAVWWIPFSILGVSSVRSRRRDSPQPADQ